jgi:hypothetical protein
MKSKIFATIMATAAGAALLAAAAIPAQAATREFNIYGASAQYTFWSNLAKPFLESKNCAVGTDYATSADGKYAFTRGTNCTDYNGDTVIIRYSSKASYDGIFAVRGLGQDDIGQPSDPDSCAGQTGVPSGQENYYRKMADENNITGTRVNGTKCVRVTVGASDVAGRSFTQYSYGDKTGPLSSGTIYERYFQESDGTAGIDTDSYSLEARRPIVVPFGFFVNNSVTVRKCTGTTGGAYDGEQCTVSGGTTYGCGGSGTCAAGVTLDNMPREMAVMIFSGQVNNWTDFGAGFPANMPVVACMRHAGSGTHATLDYSVVSGNGWGSSLVGAANSSNPTVYFNDGSGDEMNCVRGSGSWSGSGAVGYADADQAPGTASTAMKYNGLYGTRTNIRNGMYDFWSTQWLYYNPAHPDDSTLHPIYVALSDYAGNPANITTATLSGKAKYWATASEMKYSKATDQAYPAKITATSPQLP